MGDNEPTLVTLTIRELLAVVGFTVAAVGCLAMMGWLGTASTWSAVFMALGFSCGIAIGKIVRRGRERRRAESASTV